MQTLWHPSPNFGPRRSGLHPTLIVLHYTGMRGPQEALERLCDPVAEVSAHYMIGTCGTIWHLVTEQARAWHAGAGAWCGQDDINSRSLGIELVNCGAQPFSEPQMVQLETLLAVLMRRWNIPAQAIIGHSDLAPERKQDPGVRFDWRRLARQGLAFWPEGFGTDQPLGPSLDAIGYPPAPAEERLQAFRARFLPTAQGPERAADRCRAAHVAAEFRKTRGFSSL